MITAGGEAVKPGWGRFVGAAVLTMMVMSTGGCSTGGSVDTGAELTPSAAATPQVAKVAPATGPGVPEESARVTAEDGKLLERFRTNPMPSSYEEPSADTLAVIHRGGDGTGHVGWMTDEQTYCFASIRARTLSTRCEELPARHAPHISAGPHLDGTGIGENYSYFTALVLDGRGRFSFTGPSHGFGPVHQATVAFPSGRTAALLVYEVLGQHLGAAEICDEGRAHCFNATAMMEDPDSP